MADSTRTARTTERQTTRRYGRVVKNQEAFLAQLAFDRFVAAHSRAQSQGGVR